MTRRTPEGPTPALTREQRWREAPLLRVGVERVVMRIHFGTSSRLHRWHKQEERSKWVPTTFAPFCLA